MAGADAQLGAEYRKPVWDDNSHKFASAASSSTGLPHRMAKMIKAWNFEHLEISIFAYGVLVLEWI